MPFFIPFICWESNPLIVKDKSFYKVHKWKSYSFKVCLNTAYFAETENLLLKVLYIKVKVSWNNIMRPINSTKKYNKTYE